MQFKYNYEKNALLLNEIGIGFDEIIQAISDGNILEIKDHYNQKKYPNQKILYVRLSDEVYAVPFVLEANGDIFFKTLFPSRKARKQLL
jgi:maltose-binding protein MalE